MCERSTDVSERIAARLLDHPDVAELHAGAHGTTATYLPGRRVIDVHVGTLEHLGRPVREVATELQRAVRGVLTTPGVPVHVTVADIVTADTVPHRRRVL